MGQTHKQTLLDRLLSSIHAEESDSATIRSSDRTIGSVAVASIGRAVKENENKWPLDWALIRIPTPMRNIIHNVPKDRLLEDYEGMDAATWNTPGHVPGIEISKIGRTTKWTDGQINAIKSDIRIRDEEGNG